MKPQSMCSCRQQWNSVSPALSATKSISAPSADTGQLKDMPMKVLAVFHVEEGKQYRLPGFPKSILREGASDPQNQRKAPQGWVSENVNRRWRCSRRSV
jgi:hypothetical protein